jgi:hypothetical protein
MAYIVSPFTTFADTDGTPLNNGYVYIGTANLNPITSPISVYWDEALTQPAAQPLRTLNGFLSRSGTPARVYTGATNFSMVVNNDKGELVYSSMSIFGDVSQADFVAFQASVNAAVAAKLNLSGGTMTGPIVLSGAPSASLQAANKGYVDTQNALKVNKAGDTMTGKLNVAATGIGFSDLSTQTTAGVAKTGDTMTGALTLPGSPTLNLQAATKQYVDSTVATGSLVKAWVSFSGFAPNPPRGSYNVSSVTNASAGVYNINFTSSLIDTNYSVAIGAARANDTTTTGYSPKPISKTTSSFQIVTYSGSGPENYFMVDCVVCR